MAAQGSGQGQEALCESEVSGAKSASCGVETGGARQTCISFRSAFCCHYTVAQGTKGGKATSSFFVHVLWDKQFLFAPTHLSDTGLFHINTRARKYSSSLVVLNSRESIVVASKPQ